MSRLIFSLLLLAPGLAQAEVIDTAGLPAGKYILEVAADGTVTSATGPIQFRRLKDLVGGNPDPNPPPDDELTPLGQSVRALTDQAMARGGNVNTAAKIAAIYSLVSDDCSAGKTGMPGLASPLIVAATDDVLKDAADKAAWVEWRKGIGTLLGSVEGIGTNKDITAKVLDDVAMGMRASLVGKSVAQPGILDGIDWTAIRDLLKPILQQLLNRLIEELLKKLP